MKLLASLNPSKACGPDNIPNWLLKEYAQLLAFPVSKIINASFEGQRLSRIWKFADVSPLPKAKPVEVLKKQLRPISLTPCLTKVAEDCVVVEACGASNPGSKPVAMVQFQDHLPPKHLFTWFIIGPRKQMEMAQPLE